MVSVPKQPYQVLSGLLPTLISLLTKTINSFFHSPHVYSPSTNSRQQKMLHGLNSSDQYLPPHQLMMLDLVLFYDCCIMYLSQFMSGTQPYFPVFPVGFRPVHPVYLLQVNLVGPSSSHDFLKFPRQNRNWTSGLSSTGQTGQQVWVALLLIPPPFFFSHSLILVYSIFLKAVFLSLTYSGVCISETCVAGVFNHQDCLEISLKKVTAIVTLESVIRDNLRWLFQANCKAKGLIRGNFWP